MSKVIAVDGTAGSGTSTLTKNLCRALRVSTRHDWQGLNTGSIYRSVAWLCKQKGVELTDEAAVITLAASCEFKFTDGVVSSVGDLAVTGDELDVLGDEAKIVAKYGGLREIVRQWQHRFVELHPFTIMEGRDIGVKVFPNASVKIWVDADPAVRARRRALKEGHTVDVAEVERRDEDDRTREASPMRIADDAVQYDSTDLDEKGLLDQALEYCLASLAF